MFQHLVSCMLPSSGSLDPERDSSRRRNHTEGDRKPKGKGKGKGKNKGRGKGQGQSRQTS